MSQHEAILLLGSNLGNREKNLQIALELLEENGIVILKKSKILNSEPVEFVSVNIFCNIAISIYTCLSPTNLIKIIKSIEKKLGRLVDYMETNKYEDRIIDIDIVTFNKIKFMSKKLNIPHKKHLFQRNFSKTLLKNLTNDI